MQKQRIVVCPRFTPDSRGSVPAQVNDHIDKINKGHVSTTASDVPVL